MTQDRHNVWMEVRGRLRAFIAKRVADDASVDDLLQEVFLKIHDKIDQVQDPRNLVSWIFTVTRHVIIDYYRASHRHRELPAGLATDVETLMAAREPMDEPDEPRIQLAGCLRPMVDQLAPEYRDALRLVELDGLTQQAAASTLGLSLSGMKSRVQRGRRQLKALLHDCCLIQLDARRGVAETALRDPTANPCAPPTPMMPERRAARKPT
ncbi:MAG: RNA polymerase sigma factor SigZ [Nitrospiraceae bacterium]|nr:RNA polymerase sigma factor SigZ [Nitrospiraceae bacterium]